MLEGKLKYQDEYGNQMAFHIQGIEGFDLLKMRLTPLTVEDEVVSSWLLDTNYVMDSETQTMKKENKYQGQATDTVRRLDIKRTSKYVSNIGNRDFCSRVGALIRYAYLQAEKKQIDFVSSSNFIKTDKVVELPSVGMIRMNAGLMEELRLMSRYVTIELYPAVVPFEGGQLRKLQKVDKYGRPLSLTDIENVTFRLNTHNLGFEYVWEVAKSMPNVLGMYETIEDVIEAHPEKNIHWIKDRKYEIVTMEMLPDVIEYFQQSNKILSLDFETTGLKINFKSRTGEGDQMVGFGLTDTVGEGYYFPLQHKLIENLCDGDHWFFMETYMKELFETKRFVGHNSSFDWKVGFIYGININYVFDTILAFGVTKRYEDTTMQMSHLKLESLLKSLFGMDLFSLNDFVAGSSFSDSNITFADLPYEFVRRYGPADVDATLILYEYIVANRMLENYEAERIFDMEVKFSKVVAYSEFFGYRVDTEAIPHMREEIMGGKDKQQQIMFEAAGKEFNPNSPLQLSEIMFDILKIPTVGAKRSTGKEVLNTLSNIMNEDGEPAYPFVTLLKKYREFEGIFKNFLKRLHEYTTEDGFIFPNVYQLGTDTGRSSVKEPNYQSYNDAVKKRIVPRQDHLHFDADFSQIEYRVLASMAQQDNLILEFDDPDLDYHTYQASRMFSVPYSLVTKALRQQSKGINFGLPYGMEDSSLGYRIFGERNKETRAKAALLRKKFFEGQEKIEAFFEKVRSEGVAKGYTSTYFGRRRYYNKGSFSVAEIRRQAGNHVIQGTAADIYKESCNRMFARIVREGWLGLVLINVFVHDEILMEVHKSINMYYFFKAWREEFQLVIKDFCKLYAGAGVGMNWYDAKKQDLPVQYIDDIINQYHEDMDWHENIEQFLDEIVTGYEDYKTRRVETFYHDPANDGEIIKPVIYALLVEMTEKALQSFYRPLQGTPEALNQLIAQVERYNQQVGVPIFAHPTDLLKENSKKPKYAKLKKLTDYIAVYSLLYGVDLTNYRILAPEDAVVQPSTPTVEQDLADVLEDQWYQTGTGDNEPEIDLTTLLHFKGYHVTEDLTDPTYPKYILTIMDLPMTYQGITTTLINYLYSQGCFKPSGRYQVAVYNPNDQTTMLYDAFMSEQDYQTLMTTYAFLKQQNYGNHGTFSR